MNAEQKELLRLGILQVLAANNTRFGVSVKAMCLKLIAFGFRSLEERTVQDEFEYLVSKKLAEELVRVVSKENRCWKITDAGIAFLDEQGLM